MPEEKLFNNKIVFTSIVTGVSSAFLAIVANALSINVAWHAFWLGAAWTIAWQVTKKKRAVLLTALVMSLAFTANPVLTGNAAQEALLLVSSALLFSAISALAKENTITLLLAAGISSAIIAPVMLLLVNTYTRELATAALNFSATSFLAAAAGSLIASLAWNKLRLQKRVIKFISSY